jgi:hypothetical protein
MLMMIAMNRTTKPLARNYQIQYPRNHQFQQKKEHVYTVCL